MQLPEDPFIAEASDLGLDFSATSMLNKDGSPKKKRGRPRKSIQPSSDNETIEIESVGNTPRYALPVIEPIAPTPQADLSQSIRMRKGTPAAKANALIELSSDDDMNTPSDSDEDAPMNKAPSLHVSRADDMAPMDAPEFSDVEDEGELQDATGFAFEEGATRGPDDTTIVESEHFSMISVASLPSAGGLPTPAPPPTAAISHTTVQNHEYLQIPAGSTHPVEQVSASTNLDASATTKVTAVRPPLSRYKTPVMDEKLPSNPPPIEAARSSPFEAETPKIGSVVKAGVALQGVLDPTRATPEAGPSKSLARRTSELDDLFRGFSDRTRKELRAGLRLGEQLAQDNASDKGSPAVSSPIKDKNTTGEDAPETKDNESRLLTPEEIEHENPEAPVSGAPQNSNVQYPRLNPNDSQLPTPSISPAHSEDEMSWKVDTPPVNSIVGAQGRTLTVTNEHGEVIRGSDIVVEADDDVQMNEEETQDLWLEEAGPSRPVRGRLPNTWRRKENVQEQSKGKAATVEDEEHSNVSDGTGIFFQANRRSAQNKKPAEKLDLSTLMNEGGSLLPDSSPPVAASTSRAANPFLGAPPRFTVFSSSPLRKEVRSSPSDRSRGAFEESTLPVAQSSPFRTIVDGDKTTADQQDDVNNTTDTSIRNIRNEANEYVDAYDLRDRSLGDITEVTEASNRSFTKRKPSERLSPQKQVFKTSMSKSGNNQSSLFDTRTESPPKRAAKKQRGPEPTHPRIAVAPRTEEVVEKPTQPSTGLFSRLGSTFKNTFTTTTPAKLPIHPAIAKHHPLPRVEPWTRTHYKALDRLFHKHTRKPSLLSPHHSSPSSVLNTALLQHFLDETGLPFVGATFSVWGYSITFDEGLVVLCAAYMQLLSLRDISDYEYRAGKEIDMGDCGPRKAGTTIDGEEVARRLASVIIGGQLRDDESEGETITRSGTLQVEWPKA